MSKFKPGDRIAYRLNRMNSPTRYAIVRKARAYSGLELYDPLTDRGLAAIEYLNNPKIIWWYNLPDRDKLGRFK